MEDYKKPVLTCRLHVERFGFVLSRELFFFESEMINHQILIIKQKPNTNSQILKTDSILVIKSLNIENCLFIANWLFPKNRIINYGCIDKIEFQSKDS